MLLRACFIQLYKDGDDTDWRIMFNGDVRRGLGRLSLQCIAMGNNAL